MQTDLIPIPENVVLSQFPSADEFLLRAVAGRSDTATSFQYASPLPNSAPLSLGQDNGVTRRFSRSGSFIPTAEEHAALYALKRGIAVGLAIANWFAEKRGLTDLLRRNRATPLIGSEAQVLQAVIKARAWLLLFVTSAYVAEALAPDEEDGQKAEIFTSLDTALSSLVTNLSQTQDIPVLKATVSWARSALAGQLAVAVSELGTYHEEIGRLAIGIEGGEFSIRGLSASRAAKRKASTSITFKKPHEIVGNRIAKAQATKLAKMLVSYDFKAQRNPFVELGGFLFTIIGDGEPGTGKTSIIQMTCGLIKNYCDVAGYDCHFENFSIDQISDYQGRSGHNARQFINRILDPSRISFGAIDDIDQIAGKRDSEKNSSVGQQEVTAVLMNAFDGVDTKVRGNCAFGMFTNYPDKVDDALRQRSAARWLIDGPQTRDDFVDILTLMIGPSFNGSTSRSRQVETGDSLYLAHAVPNDTKLRQLYDEVLSSGADLSTLDGLGHYLHAIKQMDRRFTGRAIKNITNAVLMRSLDIEMPDEWFENANVFLHQSLDTKTKMIKELQRPVSGAMILEEINRYADGELRFAARADDKDIEDRVNELKRETLARERFTGSVNA